jgi:glucose/arabinose dehydrogenase
MRRTNLALCLLILVGCGGGDDNPAGDGPPGDDAGDDAGDDQPPGPDAAEATCTPVNGTTVGVEALPGLNNLDDIPLLVTSPPGDVRLFIVNRNGVIQIYVDGAILETPFLDIDTRVDGGGEAGMLGLAFHPNFATNKKFYVYYMNNDAGWVDRISEFQITGGDDDIADPDSERILLDIPDPEPNHNGGMMEFGDDGFLYISDGDGGQQGDPEGNAQNKNRLLGKILRIDVDTMEGGRPYGIPDDNPYADGVAGAPEVYVYGMRNPWRWSFDRGTGDMYVGDVGQSNVEEITVIPAAEIRDADLGWNHCEGRLVYDGGVNCNAPTGNRIAPVASHDRRPEEQGGQESPFNAIIGGQVYRGSCYPDLVGRYFYSDHGASELWTFVWSGGNVVEAPNQITPDNFPNGPASIHADALGELYVTTTGGGIYRIVAE